MPQFPTVPAGRHRVVVVGSSFAGLTAALEVKRRMKDLVEVTVLDRRDHFTFIPSLIWLPFGKRSAKDVTFKLAPVYERKGIRFVHAPADGFDLERRVVLTADGEIPYDRLVIATGPRLAFDKIPGLGTRERLHAVGLQPRPRGAAREAWERFLENPGPVVVGTAQGGSCFGASYEFLLNTRYQLKKAGLAGDVPVTFISSEPFLGHFGLGGVGDSEQRVTKFFDRLGIRGIANASIDEVRDGEIELAGGGYCRSRSRWSSRRSPASTWSRATAGLGNPAGFIPVTDEFRHPDHPRSSPPASTSRSHRRTPTLIPAGVPKTGHMSEHMAKIAAQNIAADLPAAARTAVPINELGAICILDAGNGGIAIKTDRVLGGGKTHVTSGPHAHWGKVAFEKAFLLSRKRGSVVF